MVGSDALHFFNPSRPHFRRCVQCPQQSPSCPVCDIKGGEVCAVSQASCNNCDAAWCLKVQGTVTTTVSMGVSTIHDASASASATTASSPAAPGQAQSNTATVGHVDTTGAIIGGIVGGLALILIVAFALRYCRGRYKIRIQRMEEAPAVTKEKGLGESGSTEFVPAGGRHELDPAQERRVAEIEAHRTEMPGNRVVYEMDGRSKPGELG